MIEPRTPHIRRLPLLAVIGLAAGCAVVGSSAVSAATPTEPSPPAAVLPPIGPTRPTNVPTTSSTIPTMIEVAALPTVVDVTANLPSTTEETGTAPSTPSTSVTPADVTTLAPAVDLPIPPPLIDVDLDAPVVDGGPEVEVEAEADADPDAEADGACVWATADDYYSGAAGGPIFVGASTWWSSNDNVCASTFITHSDPAHGTVDIDYPATYTPDPGFVGVDSFTYTYEYPMGTALAQGTVYVTVADCAMSATSDLLHSTGVDTPLTVSAPGVLGNDTIGCPDVTLTADPAEHGVATFSQDGSFVYTPSPGFMGVEKFAYQLRDAADNVLASAIVRIEVNGPPCIAEHDSFSVHSGVQLDVPAPGVLGNDVVCPQFVDIDIDSMGGDPHHGTATLDDDGGLHYTPDPGYVGPDQIGYVIRWGSSHYAHATVTVDVLPPCETAFVDDDYTTGTDQVLHVGSPGPGQNDTLCDDLLLAVADGPDHGSVTLLGWGDLTYEPDAGFVGTDTFTYTVEANTVEANPVDANTVQASGYFGDAQARGSRARPKAPVPTLTATVTITVAEGATTTSTTTTSTTSTSTSTLPSGPVTSAAPVPGATLPQTGAADKDIVAGLGLALMLTGSCLLLAIRRPH